MDLETIIPVAKSFLENPTNWTKSAIIVLVIFILRLIFFKFFDIAVINPQRVYHLKRNLTYLLIFLTIVGVLLIWVEDKETFFKYLGVFSAGLAIAMHETISNIAGWFFILTRKPFSLGERISIDGNSGDVIDINSLFFTIIEIGGERVNSEQSTGRLIHVPNSKVLRSSLVNYTQGFNYIWSEISIHITYESDWENAKKIVMEIVQKIAGHYPELAEKAMHNAARRYCLKFGKLTPIIYTDTIDYGIRFSLRFIVSPREKRNIECRIWEEILRRFEKELKINLAYKTFRVYNAGEGDKSDQKFHS